MAHTQADYAETAVRAAAERKLTELTNAIADMEQLRTAVIIDERLFGDLAEEYRSAVARLTSGKSESWINAETHVYNVQPSQLT